MKKTNNFIQKCLTIIKMLYYFLSCDEFGRVFVYRTNRTRLDLNHVQIKDRCGKKSVPVWAWFSVSGPGDFVRIHGKLTAEKIFGNPW